MNQRLARMADQIQKNLSVIIRDELNDPRLAEFITICHVKVSPDLGYADIYVTALDDMAGGTLTQDAKDSQNAHKQSLNVLNKAAGFLRTSLARTLKTRTTPRLRFHYDTTTAHGNYMMALIEKAAQKSHLHDEDSEGESLHSTQS